MITRTKSILTVLFFILCIAFFASCAEGESVEVTDAAPDESVAVTTQKPGKTIPDLIIKTEGGKAIVSKEEYLRATVSLTGATDMPLAQTTAQIRGRGNSTWTNFEKKAYRLKFDEKVDLLGMGAARDYVLLANALDLSMMNNYIAFTVMARLDDVYTPECTFVHLHVNGQYMGMYLLTERIEEDEERVNIGNGKSGGVDVGYLIEFGGHSEKDGKKKFRIDNVTFRGNTIGWRKNFLATIKSPDETVCTQAQAEYIEKYVERVNKAIFTQDFETFSELCDVDSFVANVLVNELLLSNDFDFNFQMYKEAGGKLFLGPVWDFDQACGISSKSGGTFIGWTVSDYPCWITALLEMPEFYALVREMWIENYDMIHNIVNEVYATAESLEYDINLNYRRWDVLGEPYWRMTEEMADLDTYEGFLDRLAWWLDNRIIWIDKEFGVYEWQ